MKKLFWLGLIGLLLFEIANVYFIMPMPGSQEMNSIDLAYFLYTWRWVFRVLFGVMIIVRSFQIQMEKKMVIDYPHCYCGSCYIYDQFLMAADHMFYQP